MAGILSANRDAKIHSGLERQKIVKAGVTLWKGALVAMSPTTGAVEPAGPLATAVILGIAEAKVIGDGILTVPIRSGFVELTIGTSADALTINDIGKKVYAINDQTVGKTDGTGTRAAAGILFDIADTGNAVVAVGLSTSV